MSSHSFSNKFHNWIKLLRWNKPTGRLLLIIPALWSLWLSPSSPPSFKLLFLILGGGICISAVGCIVNDLWDQAIDREVLRTKNRPLANKSISIKEAIFIFFIFLFLSIFIAFNLPSFNKILVLKLCLLTLPIVIIYPSSKRWFKYPQLILGLVWGFAILIPWAVQEGSLEGKALFFAWLATCLWTFGFDTVYALADKEDDLKLGLNSSPLSLSFNTFKVISFCYFSSSLLLGISAIYSQINILFWPLYIVYFIYMQIEASKLDRKKITSKKIARHFSNQSILGLLFLGALIAGKISI